MNRRPPVVAGFGTVLVAAALAAVLTANGHAVAAPGGGGVPPTTTPPPPHRLSIGVMMDPPVPGFAVVATVDPALPPHRWQVAVGSNSAGLENMVLRTGDRTYLVWAAGIHPAGRGAVDAGCTIVGKVSSPAPFSGTDLTVACPAGAKPFTLTYRA